MPKTTCFPTLIFVLFWFPFLNFLGLQLGAKSASNRIFQFGGCLAQVFLHQMSLKMASCRVPGSILEAASLDFKGSRLQFWRLQAWIEALFLIALHSTPAWRVNISPKNFLHTFFPIENCKFKPAVKSFPQLPSAIHGFLHTQAFTARRSPTFVPINREAAIYFPPGENSIESLAKSQNSPGLWP